MSETIDKSTDKSTDNKLTDPYDPARRRIVTSIGVDDEDRAFLFSLCPHQSVLQITLNTLLQRFVKALKDGGLRTYSPERFKQALREVQVTTIAKPAKKEKAP